LVQAQIEKLEATKVKEVKYSAVKTEISFDDFSKLDIRTGTIIEAEKVAKANKLLKLKVDLGFEQRTIVSGIAEFFEPDKIIGQKVSVIVNLAPRALRGIESQGMILMAEDAEGKLGFVNTNIEGNGLVIR
jgi:methionyl-tRNA synthetase